MKAVRIDDTHMIESEFIDISTNKRCIVMFNSMGIRCGYVEKHELLQNKEYTNHDGYKVIKYQDDNIALNSLMLSQRRKEDTYEMLDVNYNVHGGITFDGEIRNCRHERTKVLGFDFGHLSDKHDIEAYKKYFGDKEVIIKEIEKMDSNYFCISKKAATTEEVEQECKKLAKQMLEVETKYLRKEREAKTKKWKHSNKKGKQWKQRKER